MIHVRELSVGKIIQDINVEIKPGKLIAIIGPNGAGKSTLLKSIAGVIASTSGAIHLNNQDISSCSLKKRAESIAYLPQHLEMAFDYNARQIVEMGVYPLPLSHNEKQKVVERSIAYVEGEHLAKQMHSTLSGGEKQRIHLARVIAQLGLFYDEHFRCLLLDEHTSHLDMHYQHESFKLIKDFVKKHHLSVVAVVHDINLAMTYADEVMVIHQGKQFDFGATDKVITPETIRQVFRMNLAYIADYNQYIVAP
jgi:iron complex transport system ATP-binding protein